MIPERCELLVLGGGPAGLAAALAAAEALGPPPAPEAPDAPPRIILVEQKRTWGRPVQCAGFVPRLFARELDLPAAAVASRTSELRLFVEELAGRSPDEPALVLAAPGCVLRREVLEAHLAAEADARGVLCLQPARATALDGDAVQLELSDGAGASRAQLLKARIILCADGPYSLAGARLSLGAPRLAYGLQHLYPPGARPLAGPELHFSPRYGANYAWCFPKGEFIEAGLALDAESRAELPARLEEFVARLAARKLIRPGAPRERTGGAIPVGGPPGATVAGNLLAAGDAAGQANPLTGAGLLTAVVCGKLAGRAAAAALAAGEAGLLARYEDEWRDLLGGYFARALAAREELAAAAGRGGAAAFRQATLAAWRGGAGRPK